MYEQAQQQGQGFPGGSPFGGAGGGGAWNINMGGPGGGYRTMTEEEMHDLFGNEDPFSDFFKTFFGGGGAPREGGRARQGRAPRTQKGRDIEHEVELTLEEAYHGATRRISIKQGGHARSVDVRIPVGVKDGSRVRAAGEGESGANGGASGDLYLRVRIRPHPVFERKGTDLHAKVAVPVTTAVLGGEAQVPTITGLGAAEDSGDDAERAGIPIEGPRHARRRQAGRPRRSVRDGGGPAPPLADEGAAAALRGAAKLERSSAKLEAGSWKLEAGN